MMNCEKITSEFEPMNQEQERVILKLEEILTILKRIQIKNEESLAVINESLDALLSNLKYLPTNPSFDILPMEIKTDIFSYLCDSGAFIMASVSQEWRSIMEKRLKTVEEVTIGLHCSNEYECEDNECFMPEEILKASSVLKSDIPLTVCHPLPDVDSELIIDGLASASNTIIKGECTCVGIIDEDDENYQPILTGKEFRKLFETLSLKSEVMNSVELIDLKLSGLSQDRLLDCLLNKTYSLTLDGGEWHSDKLISVEKLVKKHLQVPDDSKLMQLNIYRLDSDLDEDVTDEEMADALCNVYSVNLIPQLYPEPDMISRLTENILNRQILQITMQRIKIECDESDEPIKWSTLIEPEDLKTLIDNMTAVDLTGEFTQEQVEALTDLPDVQASLDRIVKGEF